jgi:formyltetrahydrofolate deformylase
MTAMTSASHDAPPAVYTLVISCPDQPGLVAMVSGIVARFGANLIESHNHTDRQERWFFMRNVFTAADAFDEERFRGEFTTLAEAHRMAWHLWDSRMPQRTVILASHASHCLADLLYRWKSGELACAIPCVISNHENLRSMVEWHGIPFHYVPIPKTDKHEAFARIEALIDRHDADTVVLARFMQIMPPHLCEQVRGAPDQYPPQLPAVLHRRQPLPEGARPRREADRRHLPLRDHGPRRGADHRAGRGARGSQRTARTTWCAWGGTWSAACCPAACAIIWNAGYRARQRTVVSSTHRSSEGKHMDGNRSTADREAPTDGADGSSRPSAPSTAPTPAAWT